MNNNDLYLSREAIQQAAIDPASVAARSSYAAFTAETFKDLGKTLFVGGHLLGPDRRDGVSPFGHVDDATVAVSMLLRIGSELVSGCADLVNSDRHYAGAALVRQLVEVEYLAWAFENNDEDSRRWLSSTRKERQSFFTPAKLRKAAGSYFRSADYSFHCELGGHPVPGSWRLLNDAGVYGQLMLSDCLGHSTRIWNHVLGWVKSYDGYGQGFADAVLGKDANSKAADMRLRNDEWKRLDKLTTLPPPPEEDLAKL